jgi:streptogramin lyase
LAAQFKGPKALDLASNGDVYIADTENAAIRRVAARTGEIERVAGTGAVGDGPVGDPLGCALNRPHGVFVDSDGSLFIGDTEGNRVRVVRFP